MTAKWHPGQLLIAGFEGDRAPPDILQSIAEGRLGGVILFRRNVRDYSQLVSLIQELKSAAPSDAPLIVSVDQEGGRVQRLRDPWTEWPAMGQLGRRDDLQLTRRFAQRLAAELTQLGFNLNYAPVVDVDSNPKNPVIGDRSFGSDPRLVSRHAVECIATFQQAGLAACAKHFPGHGDTVLDSHFALPKISSTLDQLRRCELVPFQASVQAGVATTMVAHVLYSALDAKRPASLSPDVVGLLRDELNFSGLVVSDDLEMGAVAEHFSVEERSIGALAAGVDGLLACKQRDLREEIQRLLECAKDQVLEGALERMVEFKAKYVANDSTPIQPVVPGSTGFSSDVRSKPDSNLVTLDQFVSDVAPSELSGEKPSLEPTLSTIGGREPPYKDHQDLAKEIEATKPS